ncbi:MAG: DUF262 domain-containing protein [Phormidium sp. BM_Day4_Bin.17]|nr:DUF262 domain-containing protein [Phormidium sp. BM_Day4_Bin.17]UCJ13950.1 MAG: DUF262 domain-containing protein [Phormidium sp. PBR-2020]
MSQSGTDFPTEDYLERVEEEINEQSKRIDFYITEYTIELLAMKLHNGDFEIPEYQREYTWEKERKSRFVESILMGLPIPFLFFWERPKTGKLEIVDGSQRLRTIKEFIYDDFQLGDLKVLSLLSNLEFKHLSEARQRKIKNRSIRGIVLSAHTDEASRFELFERINTGSKIANPAELRRGALRGLFQDLVKELAQEEIFKDLAPLSKKNSDERQQEELVTRFFAYSDGLEDYRDKVSPFLFNYTRKMNEKFEENQQLKDLYRERFLETMEFIGRVFPYGFRKTPRGRATPKARFEAISIGSFLALKQKPDLKDENIDVTLWLDGEEFKEITGADGANAIGRLRKRINFVRDKLLGV